MALVNDCSPTESATAPPVEPPSAPEYGSRELEAAKRQLDLLGTRWRFLVAVVGVVMAGAALHVQTATPLYESRARVQLGMDPIESRRVGSQSSGNRTDWQRHLQTEAAKLRSRSLMESVVVELELADESALASPPRLGFPLDQLRFLMSLPSLLTRPSPSREARERAIASRLLDNLEVASVEGTSLVRVALLTPAPDLSARIVNHLLEEYSRQTEEVRLRIIRQSGELIQAQLEALQRQVESAEEAQLAFARERGLVDLDEQEAIAERRLRELDEQGSAARADLLQKRARLEFLENATGDRFPAELRDPTIRATEERLREVERNRRALQSEFGPEWPALQELATRAQDLEEDLEELRAVALETVRREHARAEALSREIEAALEEQRRSVDEARLQTIRYDALRREASAARELQYDLLRDANEAAVSAGLRAGFLHVVDPARPARGSSRPRKSAILAFAFLLAVSGAVGWVLGADLLRQLGVLGRARESSHGA